MSPLDNQRSSKMMAINKTKALVEFKMLINKSNYVYIIYIYKTHPHQNAALGVLLKTFQPHHSSPFTIVLAVMLIELLVIPHHMYQILLVCSSASMSPLQINVKLRRHLHFFYKINLGDIISPRVFLTKI
jgi:hypothetical protein